MLRRAVTVKMAPGGVGSMQLVLVEQSGEAHEFLLTEKLARWLMENLPALVDGMPSGPLTVAPLGATAAWKEGPIDQASWSKLDRVGDSPTVSTVTALGSRGRVYVALTSPDRRAFELQAEPAQLRSFAQQILAKCDEADRKPDGG